MTLHYLDKILKGGSGSGDFGHIGRAGKRGGSGGGGGKGKLRKGRRSREVLDKEITERNKPKKLEFVSLWETGKTRLANEKNLNVILRTTDIKNEIISDIGDDNKVQIYVNPSSVESLYDYLDEKGTPTSRVPVIYDRKTNSFVFGAGKMDFHSQIADALFNASAGPSSGKEVIETAATRIKYLDRSIHFYMNYDSKNKEMARIRFFVGTAGVSNAESAGSRAHDKALDNIFKVMDKLSSFGMPDSTNVRILTGDNLMNTSLKSILFGGMTTLQDVYFVLKGGKGSGSAEVYADAELT